jgi:tryptophanase
MCACRVSTDKQTKPFTTETNKNNIKSISHAERLLEVERAKLDLLDSDAGQLGPFFWSVMMMGDG